MAKQGHAVGGRQSLRYYSGMRRLVVLCVPLFAACYTYAPIDAGVLQPGMSVRARVSGAASDRLAPLLGATNSRLLTGTTIEANSGAFIIEVPMVVQAEVGTTFQTLYQRVSISRGELLELETRKLDRGRTGLVAGGAAIVAGSAIVKSLSNGSGLDRASPGGSADSRLPPVRIRFSIPLRP